MPVGEAGSTLCSELNRLANVGTYPARTSFLDEAGAANKWAGTTGLALIGALNVKAGITDKKLYQGLNKVCNTLAGTTGLEAIAALRSMSGIVLAAPAFTISSNSETCTVNTAITGYTVSSTGGEIASFAISPAAPAGLTFNTTTGLLSGTPTTVAGATAYTITATNATGTATRTFTLTVAVAAPAFTISSSSESVTSGTTITGYTITSTGGTIASYSISPAAPAGLTFSTTTGLLSGAPTTVAGATAYTITATNATGTDTKTFTLTVTAASTGYSWTVPYPSQPFLEYWFIDTSPDPYNNVITLETLNPRSIAGYPQVDTVITFTISGITGANAALNGKTITATAQANQIAVYFGGFGAEFNSTWETLNLLNLISTPKNTFPGFTLNWN